MEPTQNRLEPIKRSRKEKTAAKINRLIKRGLSFNEMVAQGLPKSSVSRLIKEYNLAHGIVPEKIKNTPKLEPVLEPKEVGKEEEDMADNSGKPLDLEAEQPEEKDSDGNGKTPPRLNSMEILENGLTITITIPPAVLTLFDFAKAHGLVDEEADLDFWIYECIQKRFELDYKLMLALVPVNSGGE